MRSIALKLSLLVVLVVSGAAATGAYAVHTAVLRNYLETDASMRFEEHTPQGTRFEVAAAPIGKGYEFSIDAVSQMLIAELGVRREQLVFLTAYSGTDELGNEFTINAAAKMRFQPPYVVARAEDVAAWEKDPEGVLVSAQIATPNHWKAGDVITVRHPWGKASGRIVAITTGLSPKVFFHPAQLDRYLPDEQKAHARYLGLSIFAGDYKRTQERFEAGLERIGTPGWVVDSHDYLRMSFHTAPRPLIWAVLAFALSACFFVLVASAYGFSDGGVRGALYTFVCCVAGVAIASVALYARYRDGGIVAAPWFLESIPLGIRDLARTWVVLLGGAALTLIASSAWSRARHGWLAGIVLMAACTSAATAVIVEFQSLASVGSRMFAAGVPRPNEINTLVHLRDHDDLIRPFTLRGTTLTGVTARGATIDGKFPAPSEKGVVIGAALLLLYPELEHGSLFVGKHRWPVVGVFRTPGAVQESMVWCDVTAFVNELGMPDDDEGVPNAQMRLAEYVQPHCYVLAALGLTSCIALIAALAIARRSSMLREARLAACAAFVLALVATCVALAGRPLAFGDPTFITSCHVTSRAALQLGGLATALLLTLLLAGRARQGVAPQA